MIILLVSGVQGLDEKNNKTNESTTLSPGGIGSWTKQFINSLSETNNKCYLVNNAIVGRRTGDFKKYYLFNEFSRFRAIKKQFNETLKNNKIDIVHINDSCSPFGVIRDYYLSKKAKRKSIPIVVHFHCDIKYQIEYWPKWIRGVSVSYFRKLVALSSNRIVLSSISKEYLNTEYSADSVLIPNFLNEKEITNNEKTISKELSFVLFVGQVIKEKGVFDILCAAAMKPSVQFILIGKVSESVKDELTKVKNVQCLGVKTHLEILEYLNKADVFLLPSFSEGFSIALLEAMSQGVPCIATNVGANFDMLENTGGRVIDVGDPSGICNAIDELQPYEIRKRMSQWNLMKVKQYTSSCIIGKYMTVYQKAIEMD